MSAIYYHKFEVRWSDIDANRHLANSSYLEYCSQTRMAFLRKQKIGLKELHRWGIGPVILHERFSFFKEIYDTQEVIVSLSLNGFAEDGSIYQFGHKFYLPDGTHCATAEATGVWIDTMLRKATSPPEDILQSLLPYKGEQHKILSKEDIKSLPFRPENIDPKVFS
ncbi:MAG: thioesterase [Bergeyella sp.]|nr:thioesterase [Bergeyella sp.]